VARARSTGQLGGGSGPPAAALHCSPLVPAPWLQQLLQLSPLLAVPAPCPHMPSLPKPCCALPLAQEVANFFVSEARRNFHAPASQEEEEDLLIYNWAPSYTGKASSACLR
jgi:hypothetical protein